MHRLHCQNSTAGRFTPLAAAAHMQCAGPAQGCRPDGHVRVVRLCPAASPGRRRDPWPPRFMSPPSPSEGQGGHLCIPQQRLAMSLPPSYISSLPHPAGQDAIAFGRRRLQCADASRVSARSTTLRRSSRGSRSPCRTTWLRSWRRGGCRPRPSATQARAAPTGGASTSPTAARPP